MERETQKITLWNNVTPVTVTSSTDTSPIVVTATAHGFNTGDRVLIFGHTTNLAANGIFKVTRVTANTFSLQDEFTGLNVAGSGGGSGSSGVAIIAPPVTYLMDYRNAVLQLSTSGTATTTIKMAGSMGVPDSATLYNPGNPRKDMINFGATVTPQNPYSFYQIINLDTGVAVNGATGVVVAGTDISNTYEINVNVMRYFCPIPVTWTAGAISAVLFVSNNI